MKKAIIAVLVICLVGAGIYGFFGLKNSEPKEETTTEAPETTESATVKVTFPEGFNAVQIAKRLEENGVCSAEAFMEEVKNAEKYSEIYSFLGGFKAENKAFALEGYIFPDTYEFYRGESSEKAIKRFLNNTQNKFTEEYKERAKELGFTVDEVVILASIIQKEAGMKAEMSKVSSVLQNRLKSKDFPRLQCDVTINYINDYVYSSPYLPEDTSKYGALYNTYKCKNLPAGAICNPGLSAIESVLYPAETNYLFFVTDKENNYYYAETYKKHLENCKICGL